MRPLLLILLSLTLACESMAPQSTQTTDSPVERASAKDDAKAQPVEPEASTTDKTASKPSFRVSYQDTSSVASILKQAPSSDDRVKLDDATWKKVLDPLAFRILRHEDTERPGSGDLLNNKKAGVYTCGGCNAPLFDSETKYESGTGWPSFYQPIEDARLGRNTDHKLIMPRTEVHCARCGGHLGHVFNDGPKPTGKRYCINSASLDFVPISGTN